MGNECVCNVYLNRSKIWNWQCIQLFTQFVFQKYETLWWSTMQSMYKHICFMFLVKCNTDHYHWTIFFFDLSVLIWNERQAEILESEVKSKSNTFVVVWCGHLSFQHTQNFVSHTCMLHAHSKFSCIKFHRKCFTFSSIAFNSKKAVSKSRPKKL